LTVAIYGAEDEARYRPKELHREIAACVKDLEPVKQRLMTENVRRDDIARSDGIKAAIMPEKNCNGSKPAEKVHGMIVKGRWTWAANQRTKVR
jgi:hypothetical protein